MATQAVIDAVIDRLAEAWSRCPVRGPNERAGLPNDGSAFIQVEFPRASSRQISVGAPGANLYREEGLIVLVLLVERGAGVRDGLQWADELGTLFRGKAFGGIQTFGPSTPTLSDDNDNGLYFTLEVTIPYQADMLA